MTQPDPRATARAGRIATLHQEIKATETRLSILRGELDALATPDADILTQPSGTVNRCSSSPEKIALYRLLFAGRKDAYAQHWTSARTGKSGWSPAVQGGFYTDETTDADLLPLTDRVIEQHLTGAPASGKDLHVGLYPMLPDDSCRLLVCDFDDGEWKADAAAYAAACAAHDISVGSEISRSGAGAHIWIFFAEPTPAHIARSIGASLLREAIATRGSMSLSSYDRFFPAQDLLPRRSPGRMRLGNLIALPLQGRCRKVNTTVFADPHTWEPYDDQFAFLSSIKPMTATDVDVTESALRPMRIGPTEPPMARRREPKPIRGQQISLTGLTHVTLRLGAMVTVPTEGIPMAIVAELKHVASLPNPEFYRRQAQRFSTFGTPRFVYCFEHDEEGLRLPRGLREEAERILSTGGIAVDSVSDLPTPTPVKIPFNGTLRPEQRAAVDALRAHDMGVLVAPPGSGKTVMACALIAHRSVPTAIVVNRAELVTQWRERLTKYLGIESKQIGQLGNGRRKRRLMIDIIMLQSIAHRDANPALLNDYGLVVVDECHALGAPSTEAAIRSVAVPCWLGLTATPYRADQMDGLITMQCGPVRHRIEHETNVSKELVIHETGFTTEEPGTDGPSIQAIYGELARSAARNHVIVTDVLDAYRAGRNCLILSNRVEQVEALANSLRASAVDVFALHGRLSPTERLTVRSEVATRSGDDPFVLVAIDKIAGEGLDLPALDTLFLAVPISFKGRVVQQLGRITRVSRDSVTSAQVHDYHDRNVPLFDRMFYRRRRVMLKQGFTPQDSTNTSLLRADGKPTEASTDRR